VAHSAQRSKVQLGYGIGDVGYGIQRSTFPITDDNKFLAKNKRFDLPYYSVRHALCAMLKMQIGIFKLNLKNTGLNEIGGSDLEPDLARLGNCNCCSDVSNKFRNYQQEIHAERGGFSVGRSLVSVGQYMAGLGSITIVANFEMNYIAGFAMTWWGFIMGVVVLILTVSGWVVYRFRQTRALTMAQFFEIRYSRNFRIFAGILAFLSGIINFGIFPAVGARFFIYFCGLPQTIPLFGIDISTFALIMIIILTLALFFVFSGGQIAVMITDFLQGSFVNILFIIIIIYLMLTINFSKIFEALQSAPVDKSLINPFKTSKVEAFNIWYFLIGVVGAIYSTLSWQGAMAYNSSAKSAHEAKM
jgi:Na+/proline symporter